MIPTVDDDDLPPEGASFAQLVIWLARRLGRRPTIPEIATARAAVAAAAHRRRRHAAARRPVGRGRAVLDEGIVAVREILGSPEFQIVIALAWAVTNAVVGHVTRQRITVPVSLVRPIAPAGPSASILKAQQARRRAKYEKHFGDPAYSKALTAILRSSGVPRHSIQGRSAWSIVEAEDSETAAYLRSLANDTDRWKAARADVARAQRKAWTAIHDDGSRWDRLGWLTTTVGATGYCAAKVWRKKGAALSVEPPELEPPTKPAPPEQEIVIHEEGRNR